jgi:hypothetical protein
MFYVMYLTGTFITVAFIPSDMVPHAAACVWLPDGVEDLHIWFCSHDSTSVLGCLF